MKQLFILFSLLLVLICSVQIAPTSSLVFAGDDLPDGFEEDFDGFNDTEDPGFDDFNDFNDFDEIEDAGDAGHGGASEDKSLQLPFDLNGSIKAGTSYNFAHSAPSDDETDWRGFSKLKSELRLELSKTFSNSYKLYISGKGEYDFIYRIRGDEEFSPEVIDAYESELEIEKAYVQGSLTDKLDFKLGRQIVVWGKSDTIRVVDVLNPLDIREPGLTDIEDLRLPLTMSKLDYYFKNWTISGMMIHEIRFDKLPVWGSDFYPAKMPLPYEIKPESSWENTEYAVSLSTTFSGGDIAFYYADIFNDMFHVESVSDGNPPQYDPHLEHAKIQMVGSDINLAFGNWLIKSEVALLHDIAFFNPADNDGSQIIKGDLPVYDRIDLLTGFEYMGFHETVISIDAVVRHISNYDDLLEAAPEGPDETEEQWAFRVSRTFINETLTLEFLASVYGWDGEGGSYERISTEYDISDSLETRGGLMFYQSGTRTGFQDIGSNDRVFIEIEYSF